MDHSNTITIIYSGDSPTPEHHEVCAALRGDGYQTTLADARAQVAARIELMSERARLTDDEAVVWSLIVCDGLSPQRVAKASGHRRRKVTELVYSAVRKLVAAQPDGSRRNTLTGRTALAWHALGIYL